MEDGETECMYSMFCTVGVCVYVGRKYCTVQSQSLLFFAGGTECLDQEREIVS